jgi:hypothetical protein
MITVEFCAEADAAKPIEAMTASDGILKRWLYNGAWDAPV